MVAARNTGRIVRSGDAAAPNGTITATRPSRGSDADARGCVIVAVVVQVMVVVVVVVMVMVVVVMVAVTRQLERGKPDVGCDQHAADDRVLRVLDRRAELQADDDDDRAEHDRHEYVREAGKTGQPAIRESG